jgi:23S rRNA (adenine2503-C2)-methyltransferase
VTAPSKLQNYIDLYGLTYVELKDMLANWGFSHYFADKLWKYLYITRIDSLDQMTSLRADLVDCLRQKVSLDIPATIEIQKSDDGLTKKYLLRLRDGEHIECVIMDYDGRKTACISSQVGCAMGCVFCATGQMGLRRNLSSGEIVVQVVYLMRQLESDGGTIRNVVFMGMGEPLHNYDATMTAIEILTENKGLAIGPRYITVSTVGLPSGIRRLAEERQPVNLAVSLHAATEKERKDIVPISGRWPLSDVL